MRRPFRGYYPITQVFGVNPEAYARFGMRGHNGVDYGLPSYTQVVAPHSGVVIEAGWSYLGYGYYVKIQNGVEGSVMGHLGRVDVRPGQWVNEGQNIALSDNTGNSTGPHLHWGYYRLPRNRANGYDGFIPQYPYITNPGSWGGGKDEGENMDSTDKNDEMDDNATKTFQNPEALADLPIEDLLPPDLPEEYARPVEQEETKPTKEEEE